MKRSCFYSILLFACHYFVYAIPSGAQSAKHTHYLFAYFTGNAKPDESIHFAISSDGLNYRALNNNKPVISSPLISSTGGVRDPHILRGADGKTFYMVVTDMVSANGWNSNRAMVLLRSKDLVNWESHIVNIQQRFPGNDSLLRVWAPQTIYDTKAKKYMIYWSMKHGKENDKIYYAYANADFSDLETTPKQLFFKPDGGACIDGDIVYKDGRYHLFFKTEGSGAGIKVAVSDSLTGGYVLRDRYVQQTKDPVEGAGVFKLNDGNDYVLMYDVYTKGKYQFTRSADLENFKVIDEEVSMNFHPRHGTVMPVTTAEAERLVKKWGLPETFITNTRSPLVKKINVALDTVNRILTLSVKPGTSLKQFDPMFGVLPGVRIHPAGKQDFSKSPVRYTVSIKDKPAFTYTVSVQENHNPVLQGYYADPDIIYSEKHNTFYLYPTSDGFSGWSGTYFKTFSSADLVNWKDEGVVLDIEKDVSWAKKNAWAPAIIERKTGDKYRYYFYFCAEQKIGVAVADDPAGPFVDAGKPLIDQRPDGGKGGQQIDPMVFRDPASGKYFLYWGNGYMAGAELNDDMVSLKPGTTQMITPDKSFREGVYVFFRNGKYYFLWSEDDTRSENYRVRYGTATSPLDKIQVPAENLVIAKDTANGIYGTGHNSVIQLPGRDEWYIVYHRFNYPQGITMGRAAGYNRETCIDRLQFNADGSIKRVVPTHKGIEALKIPGKKEH
jgi:arabinoxylan arabinofuranohydrolase